MSKPPEIQHAFQLLDYTCDDQHFIAYCPCGWVLSHQALDMLATEWVEHLPQEWQDAL